MLTRISTIVIVTIVLIFLLYIYYFAIDFPFQDDLLLLDFVERVHSGNLGFAGFFRELFRTCNDHKLVIPRLVSLIDFKCNGYLNFRSYILIVSLNLLYILFFLYFQFRKMQLPVFYFLPVPFLLLQPQFHEVSLWALTGMQHSFLTVFLISALWLASNPGQLNFYAAVALCFMATFTHGNGILSFPAVIFFLLCKKEYKKAAIMGFFMVVALCIYLADYQSGQAASWPASAAAFFSSLLGFIGASMSQWNDYLFYSIFWGSLITLFYVFLVFQVLRTSWVFKKEVESAINLELLSLFGFIFLTSFVIAVFRSWQGVTVISRFELYAALSSCIFYLLLLNYFQFFRLKHVVAAVVFLSLCYWAHSYYRYSKIVADKRTSYLADIYNWRYERTFLTIEKSMLNNAAFYLYPTFRNGIFRLPKAAICKDELDSLIVKAETDSRAEDVELLALNQTKVDRKQVLVDTAYYLTNGSLPNPTSSLNDRYLVLRSSKTRRNYLLSANPEVAGRKNVLLTGEYYRGGFFCFVQKLNFPSADYQIGLLDIDWKGQKKFLLFSHVLRVNGSRLSLASLD